MIFEFAARISIESDWTFECKFAPVPVHLYLPQVNHDKALHCVSPVALFAVLLIRVTSSLLSWSLSHLLALPTPCISNQIPFHSHRCQFSTFPPFHLWMDSIWFWGLFYSFSFLLFAERGNLSLKSRRSVALKSPISICNGPHENSIGAALNSTHGLNRYSNPSEMLKQNFSSHFWRRLKATEGDWRRRHFDANANSTASSANFQLRFFNISNLIRAFRFWQSVNEMFESVTQLFWDIFSALFWRVPRLKVAILGWVPGEFSSFSNAIFSHLKRVEKLEKNMVKFSRHQSIFDHFFPNFPDSLCGLNQRSKSAPLAGWWAANYLQMISFAYWVVDDFLRSSWRAHHH